MKNILISYLLLLSIFTSFAQDDFDKGYDLYKNKDYKGAILSYSKYIASNPKDEKAYFNRSLAYYDLDDYAMAIIDAEAAIKLKYDYHSAYYQLAICK